MGVVSRVCGCVLLTWSLVVGVFRKVVNIASCFDGRELVQEENVDGGGDENRQVEK